jgi:uncharacterized membrane protein
MRALSWLGTLATLIAATAILAALVHLIVVLLVPAVAERDAFARLEPLGEPNVTIVLPRAGPAERMFPYSDPAVAVAFCRFDLASGPVRITAPAGRAFASLSFHSRRAQSFYALTDKAATEGVIEAVLATPEDIRALKAMDNEEDPSHDLRVAAPDHEGVVMFRVFSEEPSLYASAEDEAKQLTCKPEPLPR